MMLFAFFANFQLLDLMSRLQKVALWLTSPSVSLYIATVMSRLFREVILIQHCQVLFCD